MNNWRLLLLAVVAVLLPIGSFTESNLIDGRQECCDYRSNSATQESSLYGNRKATPEDRRLNSPSHREDSRRLQARTDPIVRSKERLFVERTERRITPDSAVRFNTETRFAREQERRQRSESRESRHAREDQSRRTREDISRDSLTRNERHALDSRRVRMSRDDARFERDIAHKVRDSNDYRREPANREHVFLRNRNSVARDDIRDSRVDAFRFGNRVEDNNERRSFDRRARENTNEMRRSRSVESRDNRITDNRQSTIRAISERVEDLRRESRDRTLIQRDSSERRAADRRRESRNTAVRENQSRREVRENRINENRQYRDENRLSRDRSSELRESRLNTERRLLRESRILDGNVRMTRNLNIEGTETRRVASRNMERDFRERTNEHRRDSRATETSRVLRITRTDESREDRRQPATRSLDREAVRSSLIRTNEREARIFDRAVREERAARNRRDVRGAERLGEQREQRYESRILRERQTADNRESRDYSVGRRDTRRIASPRVVANARSERESKIREIRDNKRADVNRREREENIREREQTLTRMTRNTEMRDDIRRERSDIREATEDTKVRLAARRLTRDISAPTERFESRRISLGVQSNSRLQRRESERREVKERDDSRITRDRVLQTRPSMERVENVRREAREVRNSRVDSRYEIVRNRGARIERSDARTKDESRSRDRVSQRQTRDNLAAKALERRAREVSRDVEIRVDRLTNSRDESRINERDSPNVRDIRTVESRRENRMSERQVQPNQYMAIERMDRVANRESRDVRFEAKLRTSDTIRSNIRREIDSRFRNFAVRETESVDQTYEKQNSMSWQMVFYTLQGAYLCGMLMQMLTEKTNKGIARNFVWWSSPKELIKVD